MKVYYSKQRETNLNIAKSDFCKLVNEIINFTDMDVSEEMAVSINFVNKKTICLINTSFVGHEGITDVISFNYLTPEDIDTNKGIFAELFICVEKAEIESRERIIEFAEELTLYIVHGLLHIAGYDDLEVSKRKKMRKAEEKCMDLLKKRFTLNRIFTQKKA